MSATRAPNCAPARLPAGASAAVTGSGSVGVVEKNVVTRNSTASMRAITTPAIRVMMPVLNAPVAGAVSRVQFGMALVQVVQVDFPAGAFTADLEPAAPDEPAHDQKSILVKVVRDERRLPVCVLVEGRRFLGSASHVRKLPVVPHPFDQERPARRLVF